MGNILSWMTFSPLFGFADANSNSTVITIAATPIDAGGMLIKPPGFARCQRVKLKNMLTAQTAGIPVLEAFVSYSIEFSSFPDFAGMCCTSPGSSCGSRASLASL
jgi:hypothetical protein